MSEKLICITPDCGRFRRSVNSSDKLCKRCQDKKNRDYRILMGSNERRRDSLKTKYNLTIKQYDDLLAQQNNVCAICECPERSLNPKTGELYRLSVDHDHETGKIRGLLCINCNLAIGKFKHNKDLIKEAIKYLKDVRI